MRIGVNLGLGAGVSDLEGLLRQIEAVEARGLAGAWTPNIRAFDALTVLALAGPRTSRIELGTYVVPTYPRHPSSLAQQALTVQAATGNRLTLGIGLSHRVAMEEGLGYDWSHPIRHMREYLLALDALLSGQPATFAGEEYRVKDYQITVPGATPPPVLVAALGSQMLRLAGQLAAGTAIWMGGPRYLARDCVPVITEAARRAGRPAPRVLVGLPVCVTDRPEEVRRQAASAFERYGQLPSYRAILDKEGAAGPADVSLIGPEADVRAGVEALASAGATDLVASVYAPRGESADRTLDLLAALTA